MRFLAEFLIFSLAALIYHSLARITEPDPQLSKPGSADRRSRAPLTVNPWLRI